MIRVTITATGQAPIQAALSRRSGIELNKTLRKATRVAATAAKPFIASQAPVLTGATKRSIKVKSTRDIGASVGPRIWYRHFVIGGTSRGVERNPWVDRGAKLGTGAYRAAFNAVVGADVQR